MKSLMVLNGNINKDHDYANSAKKIEGLKSILFLYNDDDTLTTIDMGLKIRQNCVVPSTMEIFKGKHLEAFEGSPDRYTKIVTSFLAKS